MTTYFDPDGNIVDSRTAQLRHQSIQQRQQQEEEMLRQQFSDMSYMEPVQQGTPQHGPYTPPQPDFPQRQGGMGHMAVPDTPPQASYPSTPSSAPGLGTPSSSPYPYPGPGPGQSPGPYRSQQQPQQQGSRHPPSRMPPQGSVPQQLQYPQHKPVNSGNTLGGYAPQYPPPSPSDTSSQPSYPPPARAQYPPPSPSDTSSQPSYQGQVPQQQQPQGYSTQGPYYQQQHQPLQRQGSSGSQQGYGYQGGQVVQQVPPQQQPQQQPPPQQGFGSGGYGGYAPQTPPQQQRFPPPTVPRPGQSNGSYGYQPQPPSSVVSTPASAGLGQTRPGEGGEGDFLPDTLPHPAPPKQVTTTVPPRTIAKGGSTPSTPSKPQPPAPSSPPPMAPMPMHPAVIHPVEPVRSPQSPDKGRHNGTQDAGGSSNGGEGPTGNGPAGERPEKGGQGEEGSVVDMLMRATTTADPEDSNDSFSDPTGDNKVKGYDVRHLKEQLSWGAGGEDRGIRQPHPRDRRGGKGGGFDDYYRDDGGKGWRGYPGGYGWKSGGGKPRHGGGGAKDGHKGGSYRRSHERDYRGRFYAGGRKGA